jgi:hypothetical protein
MGISDFNKCGSIVSDVLGVNHVVTAGFGAKRVYTSN